MSNREEGDILRDLRQATREVKAARRQYELVQERAAKLKNDEQRASAELSQAQKSFAELINEFREAL